MEKEHISRESLTMLRLCREISQMRPPNKPPRVYYSWVWRTCKPYRLSASGVCFSMRPAARFRREPDDS